MELMLASKYNEKRAQRLLDEHGCLYVQEKFDGARVYIKEGELYTRNHKKIIIPDCIFKEELQYYGFDGCIYDGELLVLDNCGNVLPRQMGNGVINSAIKGNVGPEQKYRLILFDEINDLNTNIKVKEKTINELDLEIDCKDPHEFRLNESVVLLN